MAVRKINESTLTAIGNAIRSKTGGSALINPEDMASEIESISTGGGVSSANLWKDTTITRGFINTGGGINSQNADSLEITSDYIDVSEHLGEQIWFASLTAYATSYGSPWCAICFYDENHSKVGSRDSIQPNAAKIFPCGWVWDIPASGVKYCRLSTRSYGRCAVFASFDPPVNYIHDNIFVGYTQT